MLLLAGVDISGKAEEIQYVGNIFPDLVQNEHFALEVNSLSAQSITISKIFLL